MNLWTERLIGVLLLGLFLSLATAAFSHLVPDRVGQYIATQMRMFDSLRPHILLVVVGLAAMLAVLGEYRIALVGLAGTLLVLGSLVVDYRARVAPVSDRTDLTLLWMNILESNPIPAETLAKAIRAEAPDILALGESRPAAQLPDLLADLYPHRIGCTDPDACGLLVLSRLPLDAIAIRDLPSGRERLMRMRVTLPGRAPVRLVFAHLVKPWFTGMSASERDTLDAVLGGENALPVIVVGDFNAAPWSRRMREIERDHRLHHAPWPVATWPAHAGGLGVSIDHILLRNGAAFAMLAPWGQSLGSNHRGLVARVALPPDNHP